MYVTLYCSVSFDGVSLGAEVHPAPLVTLKNAELTARHGWRCHHHAPGAVAVLRTFAGS